MFRAVLTSAVTPRLTAAKSISGNQGIVLEIGGVEHVSQEDNMNPSVSDPQKNEGKVNFKCSDVGPKNCDWQVSGNSEQEIMPKIEQHGREKHNMTIDDQTRNKVRSAIHKQAA
jgi:predicted small metal-binding protein